MIEEANPRMNATGLVGLLARAVQKIAAAPGDQRTALPDLTLHRRNRPSQPVHCIYTLGLALTVQGSKHVLLGEKEFSYGPGQSLLTTIDLPVSYHITRATATEPYLGIMLKFDASLITQIASRIEDLRPAQDANVRADMDTKAGCSGARRCLQTHFITRRASTAPAACSFDPTGNRTSSINWATCSTFVAFG